MVYQSAKSEPNAGNQIVQWHVYVYHLTNRCSPAMKGVEICHDLPKALIKMILIDTHKVKKEEAKTSRLWK